MNDRLSGNLKTRLTGLAAAKREGRKIIGYTPGGYFPEELALAAGAIPVCLARGGDHSAVGLASAYVCRWIDTFCRTQIGYGTSGYDPYYELLDLLVVPITDNHIRAIVDVFGCYTNMQVFPFGVPHMKEPATADYYLHGITRLKSRLEELTGNEITEPKLREAILLCNKERELLRNISLMRLSDEVPLRCRDFVALNHATLVADKEAMIGVLKTVHDEVQGYTGTADKGPRILLTGSTLAIGDYRLLDIIEDAGGTVVIEEFGEGLRPYWHDVSEEGDPLQALADCYFMRRVPPAWFRPANETRDFLINLARDYRVSGVVWYQLMYRESYKIESYLFPEKLRGETGLTMLVLESDYAPGETGQIRTRVEAFLETIGGK